MRHFLSPVQMTDLVGQDCDVNTSARGVLFLVKIIVASVHSGPCAFYLLYLVIIADFNKMNPRRGYETC